VRARSVSNRNQARLASQPFIGSEPRKLFDVITQTHRTGTKAELLEDPPTVITTG
jgi:hypothetical protein